MTCFRLSHDESASLELSRSKSSRPAIRLSPSGTIHTRWEILGISWGTRLIREMIPVSQSVGLSCHNFLSLSEHLFSTCLFATIAKKRPNKKSKQNMFRKSCWKLFLISRRIIAMAQSTTRITRATAPTTKQTAQPAPKSRVSYSFNLQLPI